MASSAAVQSEDGAGSERCPSAVYTSPHNSPARHLLTASLMPNGAAAIPADRTELDDVTKDLIVLRKELTLLQADVNAFLTARMEDDKVAAAAAAAASTNGSGDNNGAAASAEKKRRQEELEEQLYGEETED